MVINGTAQFWFSRTRRKHAPTALFQAVFWRRLGSLGLLPLCLCLFLFVLMENLQFGSGVAHAAWHILVAVLAMNVQRTIYHSLPDPLHCVLSYFMKQNHQLADIHSTPPANPVVAHYLLSGIAITTGLTTAAGYGTSLLVPPPSGYDWPVFGLDTIQWQSGYIIATGTLTILVAVMVAFGLIETVHVGTENKFHRTLRWRSLGCSLGYLSCLLGLLTVVASSGSTSGQLRAFLLTATVCTTAISIQLVTFSEPWESDTFSVASAPVLRRVIAASVAAASAGFVASLCLLYRHSALQHTALGEFQHGAFPIFWRDLALLQYGLVSLLAAWPLTYVAQVRERWVPKGPNPKMAKWPQYVAGIEF